MKLNVKTGDLAVIVAPYRPGNLGRIITVAESLGYTEAFSIVEVRGELLRCGPHSGHRWVIEGNPIRARLKGRDFGIARDMALRPIRDQDDEDETLTWASLPTNQGVPA